MGRLYQSKAIEKIKEGGTNTEYESLVNLCFDRAEEIYGRVLPGRIVENLDRELQWIHQKNWEKAFMQTGQLMTSEYFSGEKRWNKGFRGVIGSSLVAYLCGITTLNPMEYMEGKCRLYPFMAYDSNAIRFFLNVPRNVKTEILNKESGISEMIPESTTLYESPNLTMIDALQDSTGDLYSWQFMGKTQAQHCDPANIRDFVSNYVTTDRRKELELFPELSSELVYHILLLLKTYFFIPHNVNNLARVIGIVHGQGTWYEGADRDFETYARKRQNPLEYCAITCVEDVYETLLNSRMSQEQAWKLTKIISKGKYTLSEDNKNEMREAGCQEPFIEKAGRIGHLFYRSQCLQYAIETRRLIYYHKWYPSVFAEIAQNILQFPDTSGY